MKIILLILNFPPVQAVSSIGLCFFLPWLAVKSLGILRLRGEVPAPTILNK